MVRRWEQIVLGKTLFLSLWIVKCRRCDVLVNLRWVNLVILNDSNDVIEDAVPLIVHICKVANWTEVWKFIKWIKVGLSISWLHRDKPALTRFTRWVLWLVWWLSLLVLCSFAARKGVSEHRGLTSPESDAIAASWLLPSRGWWEVEASTRSRHRSILSLCIVINMLRSWLEFMSNRLCDRISLILIYILWEVFIQSRWNVRLSSFQFFFTRSVCFFLWR